MKGSYRKTFQTRVPAVKVRAKAFGFCRSHFHLRGQYSPRDSVRCAPVPLVPAPFGIAPRAPYATPRSRCRVRVRRPGRIPATLEFGMHLLNWNVWSFVFRWRLYFGPRGPPPLFSGRNLCDQNALLLESWKLRFSDSVHKVFIITEVFTFLRVESWDSFGHVLVQKDWKAY